MSVQDVINQVRAAEGPAALRSITDRIMSSAQDAPAAIVHVWATAERAEARKAGPVVFDLDELTVGPMLRELESSSVSWRCRFAASVVDAHLELRVALLRKLDAALRDLSGLAAEHATVSVPAGAAPLRVCDEAYVWVRRLARVEDPRDGFGSEPGFLQQDADARSKEIQRWRRTELWAELLESEAEPNENE
jgi:hypothetical protein